MLVEPGKTFTMTKPGQSVNDLAILKEVEKLVRGASPVVDTLAISNKTKGVRVEIRYLDGLVHVFVTNPEDEVFKLEEPLSECIVEGCHNPVPETPDLCAEHLKQREQNSIHF